MRTQQVWRRLALLCSVGALTGCGTMVDLTSRGGPRVYGGVKQSGRNFNRHVDLGHPVSATFSILDMPLSAVFDTLMLPVSAVNAAGKPDPLVENERMIEQGCQEMADKLSKALQGSQRVALLEFSDQGKGADPELQKKLDRAMATAMTGTNGVSGLVEQARIKQALTEGGFTQVDDALVVKSLCQQLDAGAMVICSYEKVGLNVTLRVSLRSASDGLELATAQHELTLLDEKAE